MVWKPGRRTRSVRHGSRAGDCAGALERGLRTEPERPAAGAATARRRPPGAPRPSRPAPDRWFRSAAEVARPHTSCPGSWSTSKSLSTHGRPIPRQRAPPSRVALVTPSKHPIIAPVVEPAGAVQGVIGNFGESGRRTRAHRRGGGHFCGRERSRWMSRLDPTRRAGSRPCGGASWWSGPPRRSGLYDESMSGTFASCTPSRVSLYGRHDRSGLRSNVSPTQR